MVKLMRPLIGPDGVHRHPGRDYDLPDEILRDYTARGFIEGENNLVGHADAAERGGTRQVQSGIDPNTGQIDRRDFTDRPTVTAAAAAPEDARSAVEMTRRKPGRKPRGERGKRK